MVWEYTTDDLNAPFEYTYSANLGWDDVINKKVTLEVTDSNGNRVYDDKSVSITLSLKNHKPVVIAHPDGRDGIYSGYFGQTFMLDASRSYETDQCIRDPEDPNLPGGSAEVIEPPARADVQIQDCDALENRMNLCLDNAPPGDVAAILECVDMQYELQECRQLDQELSGCNPFQVDLSACEAAVAEGGEEAPVDCNAQAGALEQCRTTAVNTVNATIDAANLAEFQAQQGGGGGDEEENDGNCGNRELFPGQGDRPRGTPDRITSICFDINFNGNWCENGEVQYEWHNGAAPRINEPVEFVPRQGMGEGDIIGVPVRVCDDGRWNGKCYQPGDGGPGHLTRGDCSECAYGTASIQVIQNVDPPRVELIDPVAAPAVGRLTVAASPETDEFIDITDAQGETKRFVFDRTQNNTAAANPKATMTFARPPVEGDTFRMRDHNDNERRFVYRAREEVTDGRTSDVLGIPHVQIGISGANTPTILATRTATAINSTPLDVQATTAAGKITITQGANTHAANKPFDTDNVRNVASTTFVGGIRVGISNVVNDNAQIAERLRSAIEGQTNIQATRTGNTVSLTQSANGFDGNTKLDASNAPGLRSADFKNGRPAGYEVAPGQRIQVDLSNTRDPEGVLGTALDTGGVYFKYELTQGRGYVLPQRGFERRAAGTNDNGDDPAQWSNWGTKPQVVPRGDGPTDMTLRVTAKDFGGRETVRDVPIRLINEPPVMGELRSDIYARAPSIAEDEAPVIENLGNRRYRIQIEAIPDNGVDAVVSFTAKEKYGQAITVTADMDNDGNADGDPIAGAEGEAQGRFTKTFRDMPEGGRTFESRVTVSDGNDVDTKIIRVFVPAISAEAARNIRYSIDVGGDGSMELVNSSRNSVEFRLPPGQNSVSVSGSVSANGQSIPFELDDVEMPNVAPRFNNPRIVSQDGFDVVVAASATDADGDPVSISVNWGDGNTSRGRNVIYRHSYANARFQAYTIRMRATDDRGLFDEHVLNVDILRPAIKEADVSSLTWERMTEVEGNYDGVRGFAIDAAGTLFTHNYMDMVRRSDDGGENWNDL